MTKDSNSLAVNLLIALTISYFFGILILKSSVLFFALILGFILIFLSIRLPLLFLIFYFILYEKLFQTVNLGIPHWFYSDICLVILFVILAIQFLRGSFTSKRNIFPIYFKYIILILVIVNLSTFIGGYLVFKQPLASLIFRTRSFYLYLIFLYLISVDFNLKQIKIFMKFLIWSTIGISVLLMIDAYLLGGGKIFNLAMSNGISGFRAGHVRIAVYWSTASWVYFYMLSTINYARNIRSKIFASMVILLIIVQLLFVGMGRQFLLGLFITTIIFSFIKFKKSRVILICLIGFLGLASAIFVLSKPDLFKQSVVYKLVEQTLFESEQTSLGSIAIRLNGIKYFYHEFLKSKLLGMGILSVTDKNSPVAIGLQYYGYNFADLGLFAIIFRFGIPSLILIFLLLRRCFIDLKFSIKNGNIETKILANSILYFLISAIILFPTTSIFFKESGCLNYGMILYFIYILRKESLNE